MLVVRGSAPSSGGPTRDGAPVASNGGNTFTRRGDIKDCNGTMIGPIIASFCKSMGLLESLDSIYSHIGQLLPKLFICTIE